MADRTTADWIYRLEYCPRQFFVQYTYRKYKCLLCCMDYLTYGRHISCFYAVSYTHLFAPCHKPVRKNTINLFIAVRTFPFRLPPNGIYT